MNLSRWIKEPSAINAAQAGVYSTCLVGGLLAALGAVPSLLTGTIGVVMSVVVGTVLVFGGAVGAFSVITGHWWLERIGLLITAVGWFSLLPACMFFVFSGRSSAIWLIITLIVGALLSIFIRYRRIDWAYLDPTK